MNHEQEGVPSPAVFLTAEWRHLVLLNFPIDPGLLRSRVPAGTELDTFEGQSYVSLVGFMFLNTRVLGVPVPCHVNFEEVNLRFYVQRGGERGVVFVREIVPRQAIAAVARVVYNEHYMALPMRHQIVLDGDEGHRQVRYEWRVGRRWNRLGGRPVGTPRAQMKGSLESFITEHYWGYCTQRDGGCVEYQVEHPSWKVWDLEDVEMNIDAAALYGAEFVPVLAGSPTSAFLADGSPIAVRQGQRL